MKRFAFYFVICILASVLVADGAVITSFGGGSAASYTNLFQNGANALDERNGVTAQAYNVYNTWTDASNYERIGAFWSANVGKIGTQAAGTGTGRGLDIGTFGSAGNLTFVVANSSIWRINAAGQLFPITDGSLIGTAVAGQNARIAFGLGSTALGRMSGVLSNSAAYAAITNTVTETYFAIGTDGKLPAAVLNTAKQRLEWTLSGVYSTTVTDGLTLRVKLCTVSGCGSGTVTTLAATGVVTPAASLTDSGWTCQGSLNVFTNGASGTADTQGWAAFSTAASTAALAQMKNTTTATLNLTVDQFLSVSIEWNAASASNSITLRNFGARIY
jgi:hypothetical protein